MSEEKIQNKYIEQDPPLADSPQLERKHNDYLAYLKEKLNFILATYGKRLTSANGDINELQRTANETSSRISDAEGDISTISQRADNIELSVAKLSSLGGRNYIWALDKKIHSEVTLTGVSVSYDESKNGEYFVNCTTASSTARQVIYPADVIPVPPELIGKTMTLHADKITPNGSNDPRVYLIIADISGTQITSPGLSPDNLSNTFTVPAGAVSFRPLIRVRQNGTTAVNEAVTVRGLKLEKGEVNTDWSPAPEDAVNGGNIISKINVSSEGITIAANKVDLQGYVTFSNLSTSGQTAINGANITTGLIKDAANKNSWDLNSGAFTITNGSINITTSSSTYDVIKFQNNEWKNAFSPLEYRIWNTNNKKAILIQAGGQYFYDNYTDGGTNTNVAYVGQTGFALHNSAGQNVANIWRANNSDASGVSLSRATDSGTFFSISDMNRYRMLLDMEYGLRFWNASGTQTASYPAEGLTYANIKYIAHMSDATYDLDHTDQMGIYLYASAAQNTPTNAGGVLLALESSATYKAQVAFANSSSTADNLRIYSRRYYNGTWTPWHEISYT